MNKKYTKEELFQKLPEFLKELRMDFKIGKNNGSALIVHYINPDESDKIIRKFIKWIY